jgi:SAM-dependent methyltransferase
MPASPASLANRLVDLARGGRTLLLRLLSPAERVLRGATGRGHLPPLWLRRHAGPVGRFESAAEETAALLDRLELVRPGDLVVDLGCGCGGMAPALGERVGEEGRYLGIDVHGPSIVWCRHRWATDPRFRFELAEISSPYFAGAAAIAAAGAGARPAESYRLPLSGETAGFVLAKSLFTHLLAPEARAYLSEIRRVLAPGRRALVTAFLFAGGEVEPAAFPHPRPAGAGSPVRWRRALRPHAAVAYDRRSFEEMIGEAGLAVAAFVAGYWPGTSRPPGGQDLLVLEPVGGPSTQP